jgi:transketolase
MKNKFIETLIELAEKDNKIYLVDGDNRDANFTNKFPKRSVSVGTCEQAMIGIAAGMATEGLKPFVYSLTPFLIERPFEQIKMNIDAQNLPVVLVGYDAYPTFGPAHNPLDITGLVKCFKNIKSYFPKDDSEVRDIICEAYKREGPSFIHLQRHIPGTIIYNDQRIKPLDDKKYELANGKIGFFK